MTLKKSDGTWSQRKITITCTVVVAIATVIMALPTAGHYCAAAVSPWTQMPDKLDEINHRLKRLETALHVTYDNTNAVRLADSNHP